MPTLDWNTVLAALGYAALTGIFNLIFARKSQIEAWAESRPRLAALLKMTRSLGFDPWNALSALSLFFAKKLPQVQKSDSVIAQVEQQKASAKARADAAGDDTVHFGPPLLVLLVAGLCLSQQACSSWKPVARSADGIAEALCGQFFGEKMSLSIEEAARQFCTTQDDLRPWIDALIAAKREAAPKAQALHP